MAQAFMRILRKHRRKVITAIIIIFALLIILGYAMKEDKTWGLWPSN
ncbi:MAG: hypothetical protein ACYSUP_10505 [Planctomycetota bacterium]